MFGDKGEISIISVLMLDICEGRVSRNKNYYTLSRVKERYRFKRAKLLISLVEDLERTVKVPGNEIGTCQAGDYMEVFLYDPVLRYNRRVLLSEDELGLIRQKTKIALHSS